MSNALEKKIFSKSVIESIYSNISSWLVKVYNSAFTMADSKKLC